MFEPTLLSLFFQIALLYRVFEGRGVFHWSKAKDRVVNKEVLLHPKNHNIIYD